MGSTFEQFPILIDFHVENVYIESLWGHLHTLNFIISIASTFNVDDNQLDELAYLIDCETAENIQKI